MDKKEPVTIPGLNDTPRDVALNQFLYMQLLKIAWINKNAKDNEWYSLQPRKGREHAI
jgi:hypothetical protein